MNLNIATMQVGRKEAGGEAIMVLTFDEEIPEDALSDLAASPELSIVQGIELPAY